MNRVLITGADGFTGRYVAQELRDAGLEVHGLARRLSPNLSKGVQFWHTADLLDVTTLKAVVEKVRPQWVVHLAAISFVAHGSVEDIYRINIVGTRNLLQCIHEVCPEVGAVLLASSANIYGNSDAGVISEEVTPAPANDYAVSKLAMEYMAKLWLDRLPVIITRPFNYTGVGQSDKFLLPKMVSHFGRNASSIELGNLDVSRDFSDVRMVASVYRRLLFKSDAVGGVFNVCSGRSYTLKEIIGMLCGISGHQIEVLVNPAFVRASEVKVLLGSRARLESVIGEVTDIPLVETLKWMLFQSE